MKQENILKEKVAKQDNLYIDVKKFREIFNIDIDLKKFIKANIYVR